MREIHDFDAIRNWRWQIAFQGGNYVYSNSGIWQEMRGKHYRNFPGLRNHLICKVVGSVLFGADFCESFLRPDFITIRMIERGSLLVLVERRRLLRFDAGEACLLPPYRDYAEATDGAECFNHYLTLYGEQLPDILHTFGLGEVCAIRPPSIGHFMRLHDRGFALPGGHPVEAHAANAGFCFEMLQTLANWRSGDTMPPELAAAVDFIDRHLGEPLSIDSLAAAAGCSVIRLYRLFREVLTNTPHRYIVERRMEFARRSLRKGMPVKEIAQACGYRNPFIFSAEFKKFHGVSPRGFTSPVK